MDKAKYISKFDKGNGVCIENCNILDDTAHFRPKFNREIHKLQTSCQIKNEIYDQIRGTDHHQPDFMVCQKCIKIS